MKFLFYLFLVVSFISFGQEPLVKTDSVPKPYLMVVGDTISNNAINLNEIYILPKLKLNTSDYRRRYLILQRKTIKVYPFAKLAAERLESLNTRLLKLKSKRKRKKYARRVQKFVEDEFKPTLKKGFVSNSSSKVVGSEGIPCFLNSMTSLYREMIF